MAIFSGLLLFGCAGSPDYEKEQKKALTPLPYIQAVDPDNNALMAFVEAYVAGQGAPSNTQFAFSRIDLDRDGLREGLVLFDTPNGYWCNQNGCRLLLMQARNQSFTYMGEIDSIRGPILVSDQTTRGWRDLVVKENSALFEPKTIVLSHNGFGYPEYLDSQHWIERDISTIPGTVLFP